MKAPTVFFDSHGGAVDCWGNDVVFPMYKDVHDAAPGLLNTMPEPDGRSYIVAGAEEDARRAVDTARYRASREEE